MLKNARCWFWMWDDAAEAYDEKKHLRFTGIAKKVGRKLSRGDGWRSR